MTTTERRPTTSTVGRTSARHRRSSPEADGGGGRSRPCFRDSVTSDFASRIRTARCYHCPGVDGDVDVVLSASPLSGPGYDVLGRRAGGIGSSVVVPVGVAGGDDDNDNDNDVVVAFDRRRRVAMMPIVPRRDECDDDDDCHHCTMPTDVREIESWIRRTLRSSGYIDPSELAIEGGNSAWRVRVSLHLIEDGGNAFDAALICACAAIADLRLPTVTVAGT